jgi:adenylate cyclase
MLDSRSVSRLHALIQRRDAGDLALVDLGSRNGSFVNGARVSFPVTMRTSSCLAISC